MLKKGGRLSERAEKRWRCKLRTGPELVSKFFSTWALNHFETLR